MPRVTWLAVLRVVIKAGSMTIGFGVQFWGVQTPQGFRPTGQGRQRHAPAARVRRSARGGRSRKAAIVWGLPGAGLFLKRANVCEAVSARQDVMGDTRDSAGLCRHSSLVRVAVRREQAPQAWRGISAMHGS